MPPDDESDDRRNALIREYLAAHENLPVRAYPQCEDARYWDVYFKPTPVGALWISVFELGETPSETQVAAEVRIWAIRKLQHQRPMRISVTLWQEGQEGDEE